MTPPHEHFGDGFTEPGVGAGYNRSPQTGGGWFVALTLGLPFLLPWLVLRQVVRLYAWLARSAWDLAGEARAADWRGLAEEVRDGVEWLRGFMNYFRR